MSRNNTLSQQKKRLKIIIDELLDERGIKNYARLAIILKYSKGFMSELLNPDSAKGIPDRFLLKLEKVFNIKTGMRDEETIEHNPYELLQEQIKSIHASNELLIEACVQTISLLTKKDEATVRGELNKKIQKKPFLKV